MNCVKHNFNGKYQCEHCELEILEKSEKNELTPDDYPLLKEVQFSLEKRISDSLQMNP